jgi:hypothetical protein
MTNTLTAGQSLRVGQQLVSASGRFQLNMQGDGNLVLYDGQPTVSSASWASGTWTLHPGARPTHADMQADGHLVLYNDGMQPAWGSGVFGPTFVNPRLVLQDDGNLVILEGQNRVLWATGARVPTPPGNQQPITRTETAEVGWGKQMATTATLYRNGALSVESQQRNDNWFGGLRGRILVTCIDDQARLIWVSQVFECPTRCSVPDPSCASYGTSFFQQQLPVEVGQYTASLDILQADNPNYVDMRAQLVEWVKTAQDIAPAIIAIVGML